MSHFAEAASGFVLALVAVGGALIILPGASSDPPPLPLTLDLQPKPVERAEPVAAKSDAERVDALQRRVGAIAAEQKRLADDVKAVIAQQTAPAGARRRETKK